MLECFQGFREFVDRWFYSIYPLWITQVKIETVIHGAYHVVPFALRVIYVLKKPDIKELIEPQECASCVTCLIP